MTEKTGFDFGSHAMTGPFESCGAAYALIEGAQTRNPVVILSTKRLPNVLIDAEYYKHEDHAHLFSSVSEFEEKGLCSRAMKSSELSIFKVRCRGLAHSSNHSSSSDFEYDRILMIAMSFTTPLENI